MTRTPEEWAATAATLPAALVEATPQAVVAGARALDMAVRANLSVATGGDMRLSRVRSGRGARIDTTVRQVGTGSRTRGEVNPTGPIMLVEDDTRAHNAPFSYLGVRSGGTRSYSMARRRKAGRSGYLYIPGVGFRASARHPGTRGKHPVRNAFRSAGDDAGRAGMIVFQTAVRQHLAG